MTDTDLEDLRGKVYIVTGGASGVGFELCRSLFRAGGKVYLAGRSEQNANDAIEKIKRDASAVPGSGELHFLYVSLDDLSTIKPAVQSFQASESRLDVLFNNAGVSNPPKGSISAQGHELQLATNCLGPYLFTQLLLPTLIETAKRESPAAVRVIWTSSIVVDLDTPKGGLDMNKISQPPKTQQQQYSITKAANWFLASQLASKVAQHGILSVTVNPGNLKTALTRHLPKWVDILASPLTYQPIYGAYTNLWAGFSSELSMRDGGTYIVPWGRRHPNPRPDLVAALASKEDGGTGVAQAFEEWCETQSANFR
jgi:NAD(P)-dependent dehydrogenase (short-subunit alcohol dehydrogenase family)